MKNNIDIGALFGLVFGLVFFIWIISLAVGVFNAILFIIGFFVIFGVLEKFARVDGKTKDTITIIKDGKSTTYEEK